MKPLLIANWKMYKTRLEAKQFVQDLVKLGNLPADREIVLCGPFTTLPALQAELGGLVMKLGAQNMHWEVQGAFTGEVSANMLVELGCTYVIIGHSERRQYFAETNETVHKKILAALAVGLTPIVCVGETVQQREQNQTNAIITDQVTLALAGLTQMQLEQVVIAYEPIWAIGSGNPATPEQAETVHALIRGFVAVNTSIVYGGSVKAENIAQFMEQPNINGALVGSASLDAHQWRALINY